ncbi:putative glucan endo-1,3-beta-glucosidase GVI [Asparagus officinalis]|uniref:putative glucan endo-1,3-beta-glucosidase GVI n=1 Tax=Asparagus officinalis TaxID=4686 RepID=UPI00098E0AA4|nr:putative glucan endo-1,3-beta-glucosidase GVI [Asparagus officinalis]
MIKISFEGSQGGIGVNYGRLGSNLPPPDRVVSLLKSRNVTRTRVFNPDQDVLRAFEGSGVEVTLGTLNGDLPALASDKSFAAEWVNDNIVPFADSVAFRYITVGNEVIPSELGPAVQNLEEALRSVNLQIPVTTVVATNVLGVSFPPSQGAFSEAAGPIMTSLLAFLASKNTPLLVNVYPYFAYAADPKSFILDYALLNTTKVIVHDGALGYTNLFDAIVDAVYSAMEKVSASSIDIAVSETGWPSGGGPVAATIENARIYNNNVAERVKADVGTPKRPGKFIETYLFALFNENRKPEGTEQNFGLYYPNMTEVYRVDLS